MATWGKIMSAMAEAAGMDLSGAEFSAFIQSDGMNEEIQGDFLKAFKDRFMTFEEAQNREGLRNHFQKKFHGDYSRMQEDWLKGIAKDLGVPLEDPDTFFRENADHKARLAKFAEMAKTQGLTIGKKEAGDSNGPSEREKELETKLSQLVDQYDGLKQQKAMEFQQLESGYKSKVSTLEKSLLNRSIMDDIKSGVPLDFGIPGIDLVIKGKLEDLHNQYQITQDKGVFQKEHPDKVATDENGQPLKYQEVLASMFGPEFLKKKEDQAGGGHGGNPPRRITPGDNGGPAHKITGAGRVDLKGGLADSLKALKGE